jgi:hypothetical protein
VLHHVAGTAFDRLIAIGAVPAQVECGIVNIESAVETRRRAIERIENEGSDECSRMISVLSQQAGQVRKAL